jgi:HEAT repeat protein
MMDELKERDPAAMEPEPVLEEEDERPTFLIIAQFFLIPLVVISVCVGLFFLFGMMTGESQDPSEYLAEVRSGSKARRYQAAYELSKLLSYNKELAQDPAFVRELARIFAESGDAEPELRRYLALALGQLGDPRTLDALLAGLDDEDAQARIYTIWAIGRVGDPRASVRLAALLSDPDAGVRKTAAFALGSLGDLEVRGPLVAALEDPVVDVRWNAALSLGQLKDPASLPTLRRKLDRGYLDGIPQLTAEQKGEAMVNAIRALAILGDPAELELLDRLGDDDPNLEVRSAALDAAKSLRGMG